MIGKSIKNQNTGGEVNIYTKDYDCLIAKDHELNTDLTSTNIGAKKLECISDGQHSVKRLEMNNFENTVSTKMHPSVGKISDCGMEKNEIILDDVIQNLIKLAKRLLEKSSEISEKSKKSKKVLKSKVIENSNLKQETIDVKGESTPIKQDLIKEALKLLGGAFWQFTSKKESGKSPRAPKKSRSLLC